MLKAGWGVGQWNVSVLDMTPYTGLLAPKSGFECPAGIIPENKIEYLTQRKYRYRKRCDDSLFVQSKKIADSYATS